VENSFVNIDCAMHIRYDLYWNPYWNFYEIKYEINQYVFIQYTEVESQSSYVKSVCTLSVNEGHLCDSKFNGSIPNEN